MSTHRNQRGAALPEVIVATVLLAMGSLGTLAMAHQIVLRESAHARQVMLYWQVEALNARLQLLGRPHRPKAIRWSAGQASSGSLCRQSGQNRDTAIDTVATDWSNHLACLLPIHQGKIEATAEALHVSLQWPRLSGDGEAEHANRGAVWREMNRRWLWAH